jgi:error-prone DNA polymerase
MTYVELHCHSCFSFREGASTPLELVLQARTLDYRALALTDHDGLAGAMEFARTAQEWGLQPIIGAEITLKGGVAMRNRGVQRGGAPLPGGVGGVPPTFNKNISGRVGGKENVTSHLTLLAETPRGYANLSRLLSMAHLNSPRDDVALDPEALASRTEGLIALSGCRDGEVPRLIAGHDLRGAREAAARYRELFGRENFFMELQNNLVHGDGPRNRALVELARELGIAVVATNNVHYHVRERHRLQDVLVAVQHRTTLDASEHLRRSLVSGTEAHQDLLRDRVRRLEPIDHQPAVRLLMCQREVALADALVKRQCFPSEAVGAALRARSLQALGHRQVEERGEVRL